MARLARLTIAGYPHHLILRGNNRQTIFADTADYQCMLELLQVHSQEQGVDLHAYVLMGNHLHLLVTPQRDQAVPKMMQAVGRTYVQRFNKKYGRSGTLWEGRYRSTLIQTDRYLLTCMAYIDLNPVRAGMVAQPDHYPWSSHAHYIGKGVNPCITPHPLVWSLGNTPFAREAAYAQWVSAGVSLQQQSLLTQHTLSGWALGEADFVKRLQEKTPRRMTKVNPGRPSTQPVKKPV